jgi:hypothetical protein
MTIHELMFPILRLKCRVFGYINEFAVSIQHPFTHPAMINTGNRIWGSSLKATPNPSTLVELY